MEKTINSMKSSHVSILGSMLIFNSRPWSLARSFNHQTHFEFNQSNQIKVFSAAGISNHLAVISEIDCCKTKLNKEKNYFRKINKIDYESFHSDILNSDLIVYKETRERSIGTMSTV